MRVFISTATYVRRSYSRSSRNAGFLRSHGRKTLDVCTSESLSRRVEQNKTLPVPPPPVHRRPRKRHYLPTPLINGSHAPSFQRPGHPCTSYLNYRVAANSAILRNNRTGSMYGVRRVQYYCTVGVTLRAICRIIHERQVKKKTAYVAF